jgi:hypothetical protein
MSTHRHLNFNAARDRNPRFLQGKRSQVEAPCFSRGKLTTRRRVVIPSAAQSRDPSVSVQSSGRDGSILEWALAPAPQVSPKLGSAAPQARVRPHTALPAAAPEAQAH